VKVTVVAIIGGVPQKAEAITAKATTTRGLTIGVFKCFGLGKL